MVLALASLLAALAAAREDEQQKGRVQQLEGRLGLRTRRPTLRGPAGRIQHAFQDRHYATNSDNRNMLLWVLTDGFSVDPNSVDPGPMDRFIPWIAARVKSEAYVPDVQDLHIIRDWLRSPAGQAEDMGEVSRWGVAEQLAWRWHEAIAEGKSFDTSLAPGTVLLRWPDGMTLHWLTDRSHPGWSGREEDDDLPEAIESLLVAEGESMGHCLAEGNYDEEILGGQMEIFSLRLPPVATEGPQAGWARPVVTLALSSVPLSAKREVAQKRSDDLFRDFVAAHSWIDFGAAVAWSRLAAEEEQRLEESVTRLNDLRAGLLEGDDELEAEAMREELEEEEVELADLKRLGPWTVDAEPMVSKLHIMDDRLARSGEDRISELWWAWLKDNHPEVVQETTQDHFEWNEIKGRQNDPPAPRYSEKTREAVRWLTTNPQFGDMPPTQMMAAAGQEGFWIWRPGDPEFEQAWSNGHIRPAAHGHLGPVDLLEAAGVSPEGAPAFRVVRRAWQRAPGSGSPQRQLIVGPLRAFRSMLTTTYRRESPRKIIEQAGGMEVVRAGLQLLREWDPLAALYLSGLMLAADPTLAPALGLDLTPFAVEVLVNTVQTDPALSKPVGTDMHPGDLEHLLRRSLTAYQLADELLQKRALKNTPELRQAMGALRARLARQGHLTAWIAEALRKDDPEALRELVNHLVNQPAEHRATSKRGGRVKRRAPQTLLAGLLRGISPSLDAHVTVLETAAELSNNVLVFDLLPLLWTQLEGHDEPWRHRAAAAALRQSEERAYKVLSTTPSQPRPDAIWDRFFADLKAYQTALIEAQPKPLKIDQGLPVVDTHSLQVLLGFRASTDLGMRTRAGRTWTVPRRAASWLEPLREIAALHPATSIRFAEFIDQQPHPLTRAGAATLHDTAVQYARRVDLWPHPVTEEGVKNAPAQTFSRVMWEGLFPQLEGGTIAWPQASGPAGIQAAVQVILDRLVGNWELRYPELITPEHRRKRAELELSLRWMLSIADYGRQLANFLRLPLQNLSFQLRAVHGDRGPATTVLRVRGEHIEVNTPSLQLMLREDQVGARAFRAQKIGLEAFLSIPWWHETYAKAPTGPANVASSFAVQGSAVKGAGQAHRLTWNLWGQLRREIAPMRITPTQVEQQVEAVSIGLLWGEQTPGGQIFYPSLVQPFMGQRKLIVGDELEAVLGDKPTTDFHPDVASLRNGLGWLMGYEDLGPGFTGWPVER